MNPKPNFNEISYARHAKSYENIVWVRRRKHIQKYGLRLLLLMRGDINVCINCLALLLLLTKMFVVVDEDINVHDMNDVIWAITTRADAARDTTIINNAPTDTLDPASPLVNLGSKMGIDATQKTREEGYEREIQQQVKVDEVTKNLVDSKWSDYGL